jgi:hypothetical protein
VTKIKRARLAGWCRPVETRTKRHGSISHCTRRELRNYYWKNTVKDIPRSANLRSFVENYHISQMKINATHKYY